MPLAGWSSAVSERSWVIRDERMLQLLSELTHQLVSRTNLNLYQPSPCQLSWLPTVKLRPLCGCIKPLVEDSRELVQVGPRRSETATPAADRSLQRSKSTAQQDT
eukprot:353640-Chlamydomonas_euryale.AAC.2